MDETRDTSLTNDEGKLEVANPEHIKLKVVDQAHNEIHYRVKVSAQFAKLKKSYSERAG
ncbi:unnamed protein product, partial [Oppiella nova]